ncbi:MAG: Gx transporter family protein [Lachnospiraceae bacterium]|nr:Gx transporter family protein [Lachnospiraceae bacterium]
MRQRSTKHITTFGMLTALAFILSYVETLIPFSFGIPGIKLGLANVVVLTALYLLGTGEAFCLSLVRIILAGFTFGNLYSMFYSLAGGVLSLCVMAFLKKTGKFTPMGVSAAGGVFHNVGQIVVAGLVLGRNIAYYFPFLMVSGIITGLAVGLTGGLVIKRLRL